MVCGPWWGTAFLPNKRFLCGKSVISLSTSLVLLSLTVCFPEDPVPPPPLAPMLSRSAGCCSWKLAAPCMPYSSAGTLWEESWEAPSVDATVVHLNHPSAWWKKADWDKQSVIQYFSLTSSNLISSMLKVRMTETSGITTDISQNSIRLEAMSWKRFGARIYLFSNSFIYQLCELGQKIYISQPQFSHPYNGCNSNSQTSGVNEE